MRLRQRGILGGMDAPKPFQFGLRGLLLAVSTVAVLAWLGTAYPLVGYPIIGGIVFALVPCVVGLIVAGCIKAGLVACRNR